MAYSAKSSHNSLDGSTLSSNTIDIEKQLFPYCIVWTPIPLLTWLLPFIGHMGIANSDGIIYDFAGPYTIGERKLAFGDPTKYWQLNPNLANNGKDGFDKGVEEGCNIYRTRMHNLLCDNCHSHVARCLNIMNYDNSSWNMVKLAFLILLYGKYVSFGGVLKTWIPFLFIVSVFVTVSLLL
ncbi:transmembrane protein 222-like [Ctenocephalides felis]|uniref:transmembrane protein 222-like n=1 Tax=Ctenocephalides felis TaxID=7515 RepID=UPI000E6E51BE|nr:transmembrane protein 222-like [Ctenocephalides felis]